MIGRVLSGRYEIQAVVGTGGMAVVYRAWDKTEKRTVAIKVLRPEYEQELCIRDRKKHCLPSESAQARFPRTPRAPAEEGSAPQRPRGGAPRAHGRGAFRLLCPVSYTHLFAHLHSLKL